MADGKTLVVYYSRTGTTRQVAEAVAAELNAEVEEIVDTKKRKGVLGFVVAGKDAALKKLTAIEPAQKSPGDYDLVVVGTPVWAGTASTPVRTYLTEQRDRLPRVAFFLTTGGSGIEGAFRAMAELAGKDPLATLGLTTKQVRRNEHGEKMKAFCEELRAGGQ